MLIIKREVTKEDKVKVVDIKEVNFDIADVQKVQCFINNNCKEPKLTEEFKENKVKYHIPLPSVHLILKYGRITSIKTVYNQLAGFKVNLKCKYDEYVVYEFSCKYVDNNNIELTLLNSHKITY